MGVNKTNCYFTVDEATNKCAVIDPGDESEKLYEKLTDKSLSVECIILTHGHFDHILALDELREKTGAKVLIHEDDEELLLDPNKSLMTWVGIDHGCKAADILLHDGDKIKIGESELTVIHTPGHTRGSICLINGTDMLSGDTLFRGNIGRYDLYGGDYNTLMDSLHKLSQMTVDYKVYPGHGAATSLKLEKETNYYLA